MSTIAVSININLCITLLLCLSCNLNVIFYENFSGILSSLNNACVISGTKQISIFVALIEKYKVYEDIYNTKI